MRPTSIWIQRCDLSDIVEVKVPVELTSPLQSQLLARKKVSLVETCHGGQLLIVWPAWRRPHFHFRDMFRVILVNFVVEFFCRICR